MFKQSITYAVFIGYCLFAPETVWADSGCSLVYGKNWAFLFAIPEKWQTTCPSDKSEIVVALWPEGTAWAEATTIMYVTVSQKDKLSLTQFVDDELTRFRTEAPGLQVHTVDPPVLPAKNRIVVKRLSGDPFGNFELVGYIDAGETYFIIVLTSRTESSFEHFRPAFNEFLSSVNSMKIEFDPQKSSRRDSNEH